MYNTEPPTDKTIREWYMNSNRVAASALRNEQAATLLEFMYHSRIVLSVGGSVWYMIRNLRCTVTIDSFGKFQDTERFLIQCERHFSSRLPPCSGTWKYAKAPTTKKTWRHSLPIDMLLSAVSVLVFAQSSSEIPEGLTNNPVLRRGTCFHPYSVNNSRDL